MLNMLNIKEIKVTDEWPEAISDGLTLACSICGHLPKFDYRVDSECWNLVAPSRFKRDVICLPCLDRLAHEKELNISTHIESIQFTGIEKTIILYPDRVYYYTESEVIMNTTREWIEKLHNLYTQDGKYSSKYNNSDGYCACFIGDKYEGTTLPKIAYARYNASKSTYTIMSVMGDLLEVPANIFRSIWPKGANHGKKETKERRSTKTVSN